MAPPTCPPSAPRSKAGALSCGPQCQGHLLVCISSMDMAPPRLCAGPPVAPGPIDGPRGCVHRILLPGRGSQGGARLLSAGPPQGRRSSSGWCGSGCRSARSSTGPGARPRRQGGARCPPPLLGTYHPHPSTPSLPPPSPPLHTLIPTHPHTSPGIPPLAHTEGEAGHRQTATTPGQIRNHATLPFRPGIPGPLRSGVASFPVSGPVRAPRPWRSSTRSPRRESSTGSSAGCCRAQGEGRPFLHPALSRRYADPPPPV